MLHDLLDESQAANDKCRHQKQALTFMLRREQGWDMEGSQDVWTKQEHYQGLFKYIINL
jgi:hypothetical protein